MQTFKQRYICYVKGTQFVTVVSTLKKFVESTFIFNLRSTVISTFLFNSLFQRWFNVMTSILQTPCCPWGMYNAEVYFKMFGIFTGLRTWFKVMTGILQTPCFPWGMEKCNSQFSAPWLRLRTWLNSLKCTIKHKLHSTWTRDFAPQTINFYDNLYF